MKDGKGKVVVKKGEAFTKEKINAMNIDRLQEIDFDDEEMEARIAKIVDSKENQIEIIKCHLRRQGQQDKEGR